MSHSNHGGLCTEDLLGMFVGYVCFITAAISFGISYLLGHLILWTLFGLQAIHQFFRRRKCIIETAIYCIMNFLFIAATCWISNIVASQSSNCNRFLESPMQSNSMNIQLNAVVFDDQWINLKHETSENNPMTFEFRVDTMIARPAFANPVVSNYTLQPYDWQKESMINDRDFAVDGNHYELSEQETNLAAFGHWEQNEIMEISVVAMEEQGTVSESFSNSVPANSSEDGEIGYIGSRRRLLADAGAGPLEPPPPPRGRHPAATIPRSPSAGSPMRSPRTKGSAAGPAPAPKPPSPLAPQAPKSGGTEAVGVAASPLQSIVSLPIEAGPESPHSPSSVVSVRFTEERPGGGTSQIDCLVSVPVAQLENDVIPFFSELAQKGYPNCEDLKVKMRHIRSSDGHEEARFDPVSHSDPFRNEKPWPWTPPEQGDQYEVAYSSADARLPMTIDACLRIKAEAARPPSQRLGPAPPPRPPAPRAGEVEVAGVVAPPHPTSSPSTVFTPPRGQVQAVPLPNGAAAAVAGGAHPKQPRSNIAASPPPPSVPTSELRSQAVSSASAQSGSGWTTSPSPWHQATPLPPSERVRRAAGAAMPPSPRKEKPSLRKRAGAGRYAAAAAGPPMHSPPTQVRAESSLVLPAPRGGSPPRDHHLQNAAAAAVAGSAHVKKPPARAGLEGRSSTPPSSPRKASVPPSAPSDPSPPEAAAAAAATKPQGTAGLQGELPSQSLEVAGVAAPPSPTITGPPPAASTGETPPSPPRKESSPRDHQLDNAAAAAVAGSAHAKPQRAARSPAAPLPPPPAAAPPRSKTTPRSGEAEGLEAVAAAVPTSTSTGSASAAPILASPSVRSDAAQSSQRQGPVVPLPNGAAAAVAGGAHPKQPRPNNETGEGRSAAQSESESIAQPTPEANETKAVGVAEPAAASAPQPAPPAAKASGTEAAGVAAPPSASAAKQALRAEPAAARQPLDAGATDSPLAPKCDHHLQNAAAAAVAGSAHAKHPHPQTVPSPPAVAPTTSKATPESGAVTPSRSTGSSPSRKRSETPMRRAPTPSVAAGRLQATRMKSQQPAPSSVHEQQIGNGATAAVAGGAHTSRVELAVGRSGTAGSQLLPSASPKTSMKASPLQDHQLANAAAGAVAGGAEAKEQPDGARSGAASPFDDLSPSRGRSSRSDPATMHSSELTGGSAGRRHHSSSKQSSGSSVGASSEGASPPPTTVTHPTARPPSAAAHRGGHAPTARSGPPHQSRNVYLRFDAIYEEITSKVPSDQTIERIAQSSICPRLGDRQTVKCEVESVLPGGVVVKLRLTGDTDNVAKMIRDIKQKTGTNFPFRLGAETIELKLIECTETPPKPAGSNNQMPPSNERHIGNPPINDKANNEQFDGQKYTSEEQMYVVGGVGVVLFTCAALVGAGIVGYFLFVKPNAPNPRTDLDSPRAQPKKKQNRLKRRFSRLDDSLWKGTPRGEAVLARRRRMEREYGDWDL